MTIAPFPRHRRRVVAICAATALLHFAAINWVSGRIGAAERERDAGKAVVKAELRLAQTHAPAEVKPAEPTPKPKPKPRKAPKPAPPPVEAAPVVAEAAEASVTAEPAPAAAEPPAPASTPAPASQTDAPPTPAAVESGPEAKEAAPVHWKVALPPSAKLELDVKRKDASGTNWSGVGRIGWQLDGADYKVTQETDLSLLIARINVMQVSSEGTINEFGIAPVAFSQKLKNRSPTATHFNQQEQTITFSASTLSVPLQAGAQDRASVLFQLAGIGRADVNQFGKGIDILVGEDRDAPVYRFQLVGEEELETAMGKLGTWHLVRPPKPGSYSSQLDIWLAPSQDWYPVQIRVTERNGAVTTQTITRITK
jgi:hypothetical protein